MKTEKDVEAYLLRMGRRFVRTEPESGTYVVQTANDQFPIGMRVSPPLVVLRVSLGSVKAKGEEPILRKLLGLNVNDLVLTSFGLEGDRVVLTSALQLENLDFNELQSTLDEIDMALSEHVDHLGLGAAT